MKAKLILAGVAVMAALVAVPLFAAFEAHVVNVTASIENALYVHPQSLRFGTAFPEQHFDSSFFVDFSESFSMDTQQRVGTVEYVIKQKPECVDANGQFQRVGEDATGAFVCPPGTTMMPSLCPYLSKHPDNNPSTGPNANNDTGVPAFHDPNDPASYAHGKLVKFNLPNHDTRGNDDSDTWTVDLAAPCFKGQCGQDWASFVHGLNPNAGDPVQYELDPALRGQLLGCALWVEVTAIH